MKDKNITYFKKHFNRQVLFDANLLHNRVFLQGEELYRVDTDGLVFTYPIGKNKEIEVSEQFNNKSIIFVSGE